MVENVTTAAVMETVLNATLGSMGAISSETTTAIDTTATDTTAGDTTTNLAITTNTTSNLIMTTSNLTNATTSAPEGEWTMSYWAAMTLCLVLIALVCGGNLLTVLTLWKTRHLRNIACMYHISFSAANMGTGISLALMVVMSTLNLWSLMDPRTQCLLFIGMLWTPLVASLEAMAWLVADRFVFTVFPYRYESVVTAGRTKALVVGTWVVAVLLVLVGILTSTWQPGNQCQISYVMSDAYNVLVTLLYGLASLQCLAMTAAIAREVRRASTVSVTPQERTRLKTLAIVEGVTLLCWLPTVVAGLLWLGREQPPSMYLSCVLLLVSNSVAHAFIYAAVDRQFRRALTDLLRCRTRSMAQVLPVAHLDPQTPHVFYVTGCPHPAPSEHPPNNSV